MLSRLHHALPLSVSRARAANACLLSLALIVAGPLGAQIVSTAVAGARAVPDRLTAPIVESNRVVLAGTVHPLANKANDLGAVSDGMKLDRIQVVLKRSDAQESALKQLIGQMHTPGSSNFHKWLTPDDFGKQFGPSDADVAKLESWLGSHGFSVTRVNPGKQSLEFAGTAGQFRDTFHAQIHSYRVKGAAGTETRFANASAPDIPAALAPVFGGFASLNNFRFKSNARFLGKAEFNPATHASKPDWTTSNPDGSLNLVVAPADLAVQYDLKPLYTASTPINGTGQSIAIVNDSNINIAQVNNYRSLFGLQANPPQVVIDGNDPGIDGINSPYGPNYDSIEAYLDVEMAGAVAPNAQINLVIADDTALESGLTLAMERAVYSNISPIISLSFGSCEFDQGSFNQTVSALWEQAAAQGITVLVSSGDSGSAGCDFDASQNFAVRGQAVNGLASTPYNVAIGGTDFYYSGESSELATYWSLTPNNGTPTVTLKSKVPEQPFNDSQFGSNLNSYYTESGNTATSIFAAGGGASTCGLATVNGSGTVTACAPYPKPSWQTGTGLNIPNDSARDLPDVSLFGANGANDSYTPICASDGDCEGGTTVQISGVGGTSVAAPAFAGIMALVDQKYGRQGQANYILYPLAAKSYAGTIPSAFNDVTAGTNSVPCATGTVSDGTYSYPPTNCQTVTSGKYTITDSTYGTTVEGEIGFTAGVPAYSATTGYDLASGLGSIDANNLVTNWGSVSFAPTTTTLTPTINGAPATTFAHGTAVTIAGTVTGNSPTGNVALITTSTDANDQSPHPLAPTAPIVFPLTAGAYTGSVNYLPGGTYDIYGSYSGDGENAPSPSTPVQITVTPEASTTLLQLYSGTNLNNYLNTPVASGGTSTYGIPLLVSAQPKNSGGAVTSVPTGSVVFSDGGKAVNTAAVNAEGDAEYNAAFTPGSHSITAAYSGDGSYGASTSSAVTFTVAKATPVITAIDYDTDSQSGNSIVESNGAFFTVLVENQSSFSGLPFAAPTGTLTFSGGPSGTQTATLTPGFDPNNGYPAGVAIFQVPAGAKLGNYTFNFSYAGDTNYDTASQPIAVTLNSYTGGLVSTVAATASSAQTSPAAVVEVTVKVTGQTSAGAPTGTVYLISNGDTKYAVGVGTLPTASGDSATVTIPVDSASLYQGTNQITAFYPGDKNYYPSSSTLTIANPLSDFSLVPATTILSVPNSGTTPGVQTDTINLTSYSGFAGAVALTCAGSEGVTCSLGTPSATLAGNGTAATTLSVNTSAVTAAGTYSVLVTGTDSTGHFVHTIGLQVVTPLITVPSFSLSGTPVAISAPGTSGTSTITATPDTGFTGAIALTCTVTGAPSGATSAPTCATPASVTVSGSSAATAPLTFITTASTTPGTYTVTVTGTAPNVAPTTTILVTVGPGTFALAANPSTLTIATQGGTGTSTISLASGSTYAGSVALTCSVTGPTGANDPPTCSLSQASITATGTSTLNIATTAQTGKLDPPLNGLFTVGGGVALATLLFFGVPFGRRGDRTLRAVKALRILSVAALFALIAGAGMGCGGGSSSSGGGSTGPTGGTTTGIYTVTVMGTPSSGTAQTVTVSVTVN